MDRPIPLRPDPRALYANDRLSLARAVAASALGVIKMGDSQKILKASWPRDEQASLILRGAVSPTSTANYPTRDTVAFFRSLAPGSAALKLFETSNKFDMRGMTTVRMPRAAGLSSLPIIFVAEGAPGPVLMGTTAVTTLGPMRKILLLSAVTRELNEATPETAVAIITRILSDATSVVIDRVAFDTNPADTTRPAGLLNGVTPLTASTGGDSLTNMTEDIANLVAAIGAAYIDPTDTVFIAGPREATLLQLRSGIHFSNDIHTTLGLPPKTVIAIAPAAAYFGYQDTPMVGTSMEVALHFEDTTPQEIVNSGGTPAAPTRSMFQTDVIAIRIRAPATWAIAPGGAQIVESVNW